MAAEPREPDLRAVSYLPEFRSLPSAPDAERGALCSFLISPRAVGQVCAEKGITPDHFYVHSHGMIYGTLLEFWQENEPIDIITICSHLRSVGKLENAGGAHFITELSNFIPTAANCASYLETIREKFILREVIKISTAAASNAYDRQDDIPALLSSTVESMMKIVRLAEGQKTHSRSMRELVVLALDSFEAELASPGHIDMPSGLPSLDFYTDGFLAPEVTVIMAKPSDGKTAISLNIAEHLAIECGKRVGFISLEMSDVQLTKRLLFAMARVDTRQIKRNQGLDDEEHAAILQAGAKLSLAQIFIRDDGALTTSEISATAAAWSAKHGLDILIVDHAQLAKAGKDTESRTSEVEQVSNAMKPIAKRLGIPIILLSQVTEDSKTGNYTAKNSKAIEADADNIWALSHVREKDEHGRMAIVASFIKIDKQRDRERYVTVPLIFNERIQRFAERATKEPDQPDLVDMAPAGKRSRKK